MKLSAGWKSVNNVGSAKKARQKQGGYFLVLLSFCSCRIFAFIIATFTRRPHDFVLKGTLDSRRKSWLPERHCLIECASAMYSENLACPMLLFGWLYLPHRPLIGHKQCR